MGDSNKVNLGPCNVSFGGTDYGYTSGGVELTYSAEFTDIMVDQEAAPIKKYVKSQTFQAKVPFVEENYEKFANLFPGATYTSDYLELSGAAGIDMSDLEGVLILTPTTTVSGMGKVKFYHAIPQAEVTTTYDKETTRAYNVTFDAQVGTNGWVVLGDFT